MKHPLNYIALLFVIFVACLATHSCNKSMPDYQYDLEIEVMDDETVRVGGEMVSYAAYANLIDSLGRTSTSKDLRLMFLYGADVTVGAVKKAKVPIRKHNTAFALVYEDGNLVRLPPWSNDELSIDLLKDRNVYDIEILNKDLIWANGRILQQSQFKKIPEELSVFIKSDPNREDLPSLGSRTLPDIGTVRYRNRYVIAVEADYDVPMKTYDSVFKMCYDSYRGVQNELSREYFDLPYGKLNDQQKRTMRTILPMVISELESQEFKERMQLR